MRCERLLVHALPPSLLTMAVGVQIYWLNVNVGFDGDIYYTIILNSFIHLMMYFYYGCTYVILLACMLASIARCSACLGGADPAYTCPVLAAPRTSLCRAAAAPLVCPSPVPSSAWSPTRSASSLSA